METKYCKHCGELIDKDCVVCPKCGKQVEFLQGPYQPVIINNSSCASSAASVPVMPMRRPLPWYLKVWWIFWLGLFSGGIYWIVGPILRINWKSHN